MNSPDVRFSEGKLLVDGKEVVREKPKKGFLKELLSFIGSVGEVFPTVIAVLGYVKLKSLVKHDVNISVDNDTYVRVHRKKD